jgi:GNAT superfamily N-acetyltransferase
MFLDGSFAVRAFQPKDEPGVLEVLQAAFGKWPNDIQNRTASEFFWWKHASSPFGSSRLIVAEADGALIGCHAYMPWRLDIGRRVLTTVRGVDLAVHPSYQRRGVSTAMRAAASFPNEAAFMWSNPNDHNRPGALKAGMRDVYRLPQFLRPRGSLRHTIGRSCAKGARTPEYLEVEAETAGDALRDGTCASHVLEQIKGTGKRMATVKDLDYLRWRYGQFEEYRAITTDAGTGGVVIFRARRQGTFWVSDVCELLAEKNDRRTVGRLLHLVRTAAQADFMSCCFSSRHHAAPFGFVQTRGPTVLMTLPLRQGLAPDPTRRSSWALSRGDLELL